MMFTKAKIGEVSKVISGYAFKSAAFGHEGVPVIKIANIRKGWVDLSQPAFVSKEFISINQKYHVSRGDILISLTGSHITLPTSVVGRVARYQYDKLALLNQRAGKFIVDESKVDRDFLFYYLSQKTTLESIAAFAQGAANQANISPSNVESVEISFPPLDKQRQISRILNAYDSLIDNIIRRIGILEESARCRFKLLLFEDAIQYRLTDVYNITYGRNLPVSELLSNGHYPVYGAAGVIGYYHSSNQKTPVALITSRGNGSGIVHRTEGPAFVTNNSFIVLPKEEFKYLHFHLNELLLRSLNLVQLRSGAAQPQLTINTLNTVKIGLPSKVECISFSEFVSPIMNLVFNLKRQMAVLQEARNKLIPRLITGEIEI